MLFHAFGMVGAVLGIIALFRWVFLIVGLFLPPLLLLAILGFILNLIFESTLPKQPMRSDQYIERRDDR